MNLSRISTVRTVSAALSKAAAVVRTSDWLRFKIAELFTPVYFLLLVAGIRIADGGRILFGLLVYFLATAALGHFLNDLGDIDCDRLAGKQNRAARLSSGLRCLIVCGLTAASFFGLLFVSGAPLLYALATFEIFCFGIYSFPPLRMKERLAGVFVDALYAHVIPVSIAILGVAAVSPLSVQTFGAVGIAAFAWQILQGLRNILGHQLADLDRDQQAGIRTAAMVIGRAGSRLLQRRFLPLAELGCFAALLVLILPVTLLPLMAFVAFAVAVAARNIRGIRKGYIVALDPYVWDRLLNEYYRRWLPVLVLIELAIQTPAYGMVLLLHVLIFGLPALAHPPSPPRSQVRYSLDARDDTILLRADGWWKATAFNVARIELLVDGWPVGSADTDLEVPEVAQQFACDRRVIRGFTAEAKISWIPRTRQQLETRVMAVLDDQTRVMLDRTVHSLPDRSFSPAVVDVCPLSAVYERDIRDNLLLDEHGCPRKIAFIHCPRTAGTFVDAYLAKVLHKRGYHWHNSWQEGRHSDWTPAELLALLDRDDSKAFVHNHVGNWPEQVFQEYRLRGWFCFSFVRDPGDQTCSLYFFLHQKQPKIVSSVTLSEFLLVTFGAGLKAHHYFLPDYHEQLDCVAEYSDDMFSRFLARYFGHQFKLQPPVNASHSPGYQHLLEAGKISPDAHRAYLNSVQYQSYQAWQANAGRSEGKPRPSWQSVSGVQENLTHEALTIGQSIISKELCLKVQDMLNRFAAAEQLTVLEVQSEQRFSRLLTSNQKAECDAA